MGCESLGHASQLGNGPCWISPGVCVTGIDWEPEATKATQVSRSQPVLECTGKLLELDGSLLSQGLPDAIGDSWCWHKLGDCIHGSLSGTWFQLSQLAPCWAVILGPLEMPKTVGASRHQSGLRALVHGSILGAWIQGSYLERKNHLWPLANWDC